MLLTNALIHDAVHRVPYLGAIRIHDGKIAAIGMDLAPLPGEEVSDLEDRNVEAVLLISQPRYNTDI